MKVYIKRDIPDVAFVSLMLASGRKVNFYNVQEFNIARGLRRYFNVKVISVKHEDVLRFHECIDGVDLYLLKSFRIPILNQIFYAIGEVQIGLEHLLDEVRPRTIISVEDFGLTTLRIVRYCKVKGIPSIIYHGPYYYVGFPKGFPHRVYAKTIGKYVYNNADFFVARSRRAARFLTALGCNHEKVAVIPPCIDMSLFRPTVTPIIEKIPSKFLFDKKVLLQVGASRRKNIASSLAAFKMLKKRHHDVVFLIVSQNGKRRADLERLINYLKLEIGRDVYIQTDIPNNEMPFVYSMAYVTLSPSLIELFGMNMLESLACGTPVVATPTVGARELISHERNGLITDDFSPQSIFRAFSRLLNDGDLYSSLKQNARSSVLNRYDIDVVSRRWARVIQRLL